MTKKIVLVNQHTAYLFIDIANAFASHYDEVVLMAGVIHPLGTALDPKIKVQKIIPYSLKNTLARLSTWLIGTLQVWFWIIWKYRNHEVFLSSNPPLLAIMPIFSKRKMSHLIFDVYPDALISAGFVRNQKSIIFKIWASIIRISLPKFHCVFTITEEMKRKISQYINPDRIQVFPLWSNVNMNSVDIPREENLFILANGFSTNSFFIVYSGNLGKGHNVEYLIDVADALQDLPKFVFVIAGNGYKKDEIEKQINRRNLKNCHLLGYQEERLFIHMMAATDIGIVTIDDQMAHVSIPSKTFNLLGAGKPLICFGKTTSELGVLVNQSKAGIILDQSYLEESKFFILELEENIDKYKELSIAAKKAAANYTFKNSYKFMKLHADIS